MNPTRSFLLIAALSPAALFLFGCTKSDDLQSTAQATTASAKDLAADVKSTAVDTWAGVKDYTFEKRDDFAAAIDRMADKRDAEIQASNAKASDLPDAAAKMRDSANKEFTAASKELKSDVAALSTSTADTWAASKKKVSQAWDRTQAAYDKLMAS